MTLLLADLEMMKTYSSPEVSNDNSYSKSQFNTLRYKPEFPDRPGSMPLLHAAIKLHREGALELPEAVRLISLGAGATGTDTFTEALVPGNAADLVLVDDQHQVAEVVRTYVAGREVYNLGE